MEEMLDTFDINGNFLAVRTKSYCHSQKPECFHKTVWLWIVDTNGRVLVQLRSKNKSFMPDLWDISSAGHVIAGESAIDACIREAKEELGISLLKADIEFCEQIVSTQFNELGQFYITRLDPDSCNFTLQREEVQDVRWLEYTDFVSLLYSDKFVPHHTECKDIFARTIKQFI
ncbi:MAG: NUDIX domain-containing protein [Clostridiales bacterium]|nr:NUDIX domain-containing protein [Clostridiales bacterium]